MFRSAPPKAQPTPDPTPGTDSAAETSSPSSPSSAPAPAPAIRDKPPTRYDAAAVAISHDWFKPAYFRQLRINVALLLLLGALSVATVYALFRPTEVRTFAVDVEGRVIEILTLDKPVMSEAAVNAWAERTARESFTLDFANVEEQLLKVKPKFGNQAFIDFMAQMKDRGVLDQLKTKRLLLKASTEPARNLRSGTQDGIFTWEVQVPMTISMFGVGDNKDRPPVQRVVITMIVQRADMRLNPQEPVLIKVFKSQLAN